jgi:hypothetical protein
MGYKLSVASTRFKTDSGFFGVSILQAYLEFLDQLADSWTAVSILTSVLS